MMCEIERHFSAYSIRQSGLLPSNAAFIKRHRTVSSFPNAAMNRKSDSHT